MAQNRVWRGWINRSYIGGIHWYNKSGPTPATCYLAPAGKRTIRFTAQDGRSDLRFLALPPILFTVLGGDFPEDLMANFLRPCDGFFRPTDGFSEDVECYQPPFVNVFNRGMVCLDAGHHWRYTSHDEIIDAFFGSAFSYNSLNAHLLFTEQSQYVSDVEQWQKATRAGRVMDVERSLRASKFRFGSLVCRRPLDTEYE